MTVHLMNSAMMPQEGTYALRRLTAEEFFLALRAAHAAGHLRSYIGYEQNAAYLRRMTGVPVAVTRAQTVLAGGDVMLCMRLPQRVSEPTSKGARVPEEFEFFEAVYVAA